MMQLLKLCCRMQRLKLFRKMQRCDVKEVRASIGNQLENNDASNEWMCWRQKCENFMTFFVLSSQELIPRKATF